MRHKSEVHRKDAHVKQLTQKLGNGEMVVQEVPAPKVETGTVLIQNRFSLISPGTEGSTVRAARQGILGKARARPDQVRQVVESVRRVGPLQTYRAVRKQLDAYSPLGYSSAGTVLEIGKGTKGFEPGDMVACGGTSASHAEVVCVSENLCVRLSATTDLRQACYNTLGAIAMQGVRQADLRLGESCVVIGLGLVGQLTCALFKVSGVRVFGVDVEANAVKMAAQYCTEQAWTRDAWVLRTIFTKSRAELVLMRSLLRQQHLVWTRLTLRVNWFENAAVLLSSVTYQPDSNANSTIARNSICECLVPMGRGDTIRTTRKKASIIRLLMCAGRKTATWMPFKGCWIRVILT